MKSTTFKGPILEYRLEDETVTLLNAITATPSNRWRRSANTMIRELKVYGIWSRCDAIYVLAAETTQAALLNWKNPGETALTVTGTPTFQPNKGYKGNGTDSVLTGPTNYSAFAQYQRDDCHIACFMPNPDGDNLFDVGITGATNSASLKQAGGGSVQYRLNTVSVTSPTTFGDRGLTVVSRTGGSATEAFQQGASMGTGSVASSAVTAGAVTILATVGAAFSTRVNAYVSVGASIVNPMATQYHNTVKNFMVSIGAFVR